MVLVVCTTVTVTSHVTVSQDSVQDNVNPDGLETSPEPRVNMVSTIVIQLYSLFDMVAGVFGVLSA